MRRNINPIELHAHRSPCQRKEKRGSAPPSWLHPEREIWTTSLTTPRPATSVMSWSSPSQEHYSTCAPGTTTFPTGKSKSINGQLRESFTFFTFSTKLHWLEKLLNQVINEFILQVTKRKTHREIKLPIRRRNRSTTSKNLRSNYFLSMKFKVKNMKNVHKFV